MTLTSFQSQPRRLSWALPSCVRPSRRTELLPDWGAHRRRKREYLYTAHRAEAAGGTGLTIGLYCDRYTQAHTYTRARIFSRAHIHTVVCSVVWVLLTDVVHSLVSYTIINTRLWSNCSNQTCNTVVFTVFLQLNCLHKPTQCNNTIYRIAAPLHIIFPIRTPN